MARFAVVDTRAFELNQESQLSQLKGRIWRDGRTGTVWKVEVHPRDALPVVAFWGPGGLVMCKSPVEGNEWSLDDTTLEDLLDHGQALRGHPSE